MILNEIGKIVSQFWLGIPMHFPEIEVDEFIVMPDHVHGIVILKNNLKILSETLHATSVQRQPVKIQENEKYSEISPKKKSLSVIIRSFKSACTREINQKYFNQNFQWHPRFHDHIIRNEKALENIQNYIHFNPQKWHDDREKFGA